MSKRLSVSAALLLLVVLMPQNAAMQPAPQVSSEFVRNDVERPQVKLSPWIVAASLLLGIASAALLLFCMPQRSNAFCDSNSMATLAGRATFLGSIPRMRSL